MLVGSKGAAAVPCGSAPCNCGASLRLLRLALGSGLLGRSPWRVPRLIALGSRTRLVLAAVRACLRRG
eukprot:6481914-Amphidinium_carterae.1